MAKEQLKHQYFSLKAKMMIKKQKNNSEKVILDKPLNRWKVAFLTTAGVHLKSQTPFKVEEGDYTVHLIPSSVPNEQLMITHTHYDTSDADEDINCVFPLPILRTLAEQDVIGEVAETHYGMMGYIPNVDHLYEHSIPLIIEKLRNENVDVLLASPG